MKKRSILATILAAAILCSCTAAPAAAPAPAAPAASGEAQTAEAQAWKPDGTVSIVCLSSAGGGSDINTRAVIDDFAKIGVDTSFVVEYLNDGGGAVGWTKVAEMKDDNNTLMCYGFGDVINQVKSGSPYGVDSYKVIAMVAAEQILLLQTPDCKYESFSAAVEAAKAGTVVSIGGSGGVDLIGYQKILDVTGLTDAQMPYIQHNSTGEAIVTELGNHSDYVVAKPSACISYVESGDLIPAVALCMEHLPAPLDTAPTMEELGFENIEAPMWRGFAAPPTISDEAFEYYCGIFKQLVDSAEWTEDYVEKYSASPLFMIGQEAQDYMKKTEEEYKALGL